MKKPTQKSNTLSMLIFESISVSETITKIDVIIIEICDIHFNAKEIAKLREVLRISIGDHINEFTEEDLREFGSSILQATGIVLRARYLRTKRTT